MLRTRAAQEPLDKNYKPPGSEATWTPGWQPSSTGGANAGWNVASAASAAAASQGATAALASVSSANNGNSSPASATKTALLAGTERLRRATQERFRAIHESQAAAAAAAAAAASMKPAGAHSAVASFDYPIFRDVRGRESLDLDALLRDAQLETAALNLPTAHPAFLTLSADASLRHPLRSSQRQQPVAKRAVATARALSRGSSEPSFSPHREAVYDDQWLRDLELSS